MIFKIVFLLLFVFHFFASWKLYVHSRAGITEAFWSWQITTITLVALQLLFIPAFADLLEGFSEWQQAAVYLGVCGVALLSSTCAYFRGWNEYNEMRYG